MFATVEGCQELVIKKKPTAFQKAAARITIISVLSRRQINTTAANILSNESVPKKIQEIKRLPKIQAIESPQSETAKVTLQDSLKTEKKQLLEISTMSSTNIIPTKRNGKLPSVTEVLNEDIAGKSLDNEAHGRVNGDMVPRKVRGNSDSGVTMKIVNGTEKHGKVLTRQDPFEYMKERKLSEPVMSPRKRTSSMTPNLTRCRSTVDLRENKEPVVLRELGGYKFFQKASDTVENSSNRKPKANENKINEITALKKTILQQKANITNREKHVLILEKKLATLEHENVKNKKQISSFREKLKDCLGTVDYLRHEKEVLASERDRLSFTLLTCEHEVKELRSQNLNLVTEYENAEHSRKIAIGHLHEAERLCQESHQEKPNPVKAKPDVKDPDGKNKRFVSKLNGLKEAVQKLRSDREDLKILNYKVSSFFDENLKNLVKQVRDIEAKREKVPGKSPTLDNAPQEVITSEQETTSGEVFEQLEEPSVDTEDPTVDTEGITELDLFKRKLKSNEQWIDKLANQIRNLENRKKGLLESRFAMIQEFQAGREFVVDWEPEERAETEERPENETGGGDRKRARVTKKIRKLERTLSMDHGVGKLDCIQKLCKRLEDSEQKIHELESINSELRAEHDDMEEEAKYLKYVLSYRGDVMKAQLQSEYETKMEILRDELAKVKSKGGEKADTVGLSKRNKELEEEVQRLHEELSTLLQNFPTLQAAQGSPSVGSELENTTLSIGDVSTNSANSSFNQSHDSQNFSEEISGTKNIAMKKNDGDSPRDDNFHNFADNSPNIERDQSLEEKVQQLTEEKRVLLLSMQTLTGQWASHGAGDDSSFSQNVTVLEKNLRELENENACLSETLRRIRDVLDVDCEHESKNEMISKLRDEISRLGEKVETSRRSLTIKDDNNAILSDKKREERISDLEMEIYRLHEEKKSLLSSIVRLQTDPNFTLSDDVNDSDAINDSDVINDSDAINDSDVIDSSGVKSGSDFISCSDLVCNNDVIESVNCTVIKDSAVGTGDSSSNSQVNEGVARIHRALEKRSSRDEEVQVNIGRRDIYGLLGFLQQDLDKLRTALDQEGVAESNSEKEDSAVHDPRTCPRQNSAQEVEQLSRELKDLGQHTHVLEEKLQESEAIRCDLHRTISIATDMATEERQKCVELTRTKAALEKEMLKLAKENRDLREGLETLSRARKRRNTRAQVMARVSPSSDGHDDDEDCHVTYLPRAKAHNFSESEFSDMDSPATETKSFPRINTKNI